MDLPPPSMQRDPSFIVNEDGAPTSLTRKEGLKDSLQRATGSPQAFLGVHGRGAPMS